MMGISMHSANAMLHTESNACTTPSVNYLGVLCGFTWRDYKSVDTVGHVCNLPSIAGEVRFRRLRWLGARMPDVRQPVQVLFGQLPGPGVRGCP